MASTLLIGSLTSLRFLAALWVVVLHYRYGVASDGYFLAPLMKSGTLGVPIFFILSGFILAYRYYDFFHDGGTYATFLRYRIARIYPNHLATLFIVTVLSAVSIWPLSPADNPLSFAMNVLMLQAWPGLTPELTWNTPSWSISVEWLAYLLFPAMLFTARRMHIVVAIAIAAAAAVAAAALPQPVPKLAHGYVAMAMILLFVSGISVFRSVRNIQRSPLWDVVAAAATVMLIGSSYWNARTLSGNSLVYHSGQYVAFLASAVLIASLFLSDGPFSKFMGLPAMVYLGEISYSLYLVHLPVLFSTRAAFGVLPLAVEVAFAAAAAVALHHAVEKPMRSAIRRRLPSHAPLGRRQAF